MAGEVGSEYAAKAAAEREEDLVEAVRRAAEPMDEEYRRPRTAARYLVMVNCPAPE